MLFQEVFKDLSPSTAFSCAPEKGIRISNLNPTLKYLRGSAPFPPVAALRSTVPPLPFPVKDYHYQVLYQWATLKLLGLLMHK